MLTQPPGDATDDHASRHRTEPQVPRDQVAGDADLELGANPRLRRRGRDSPTRVAPERQPTAQARMDAANMRDALAHARDLASLARQQAADARDRAIARREAADERDAGAHALSDTELATRAADRRRRDARDRALAAEQRVLAAHDRRAAAQDREQAARDRLHARADRVALAHQLATAETDPLTGARTRAAGLTDLDHELDRCHRTGGALVLAYLDVIGLKRLNDTEGHAAGDELLKRVVELIRRFVRPYDLVVRLGGDEFLCAMSDVTLLSARERFEAIAAALAQAPCAGAIRTGFAELRPGDSATELIARADDELLDRRHARGGGRPEPRRRRERRASRVTARARILDVLSWRLG